MAIFTPDADNEMFQLAIQLVNQSNRNIFLTGKAGTGKTTFLKYIREHCSKQMAVVAPTGVAAINAGGVTIHSFFQLPLAPFIPETRNTGFQHADQQLSNKHSLISRLRFNSEKKKVIQQLELLVIDEISMVRCDTLDAIDTVLRHIRQRPQERFGGVQLLFIGDMQQLPPVIKDEEWRLLSDYYQGQYFFDSQVLQEAPPVYIEFNKIYRQQDERFIQVLNQVRNNELDQEGAAILESRFNPGFRRSRQDGYIILTTHNNKAGEINARELGNIKSQLFSYPAEVQGDFSDRAFPADELLQLRVGAQVMFIRNDTAEKGKRFFNGRIGTVSKLESDKIFVQCEGENAEIEVQKEKWENIRYTLNAKSRQLESDTLGSFTQYPLRLAWAITIHKSQGLTFDKAIIDAGTAFAPGQVYVALSRCTSLEGLVLQSRVSSSSLKGDPRIVAFSGRSGSAQQLQQELGIAKKYYQQTILTSTFDFVSVLSYGKEIMAYLLEYTASFNPESISWTEELLGRLDQLQQPAKKFQVQLQFLFQQTEAPGQNQAVQERIKAASTYFLNGIKEILLFIQRSPVVTDSRQHAKEFNESMREVFAQLSFKKFILEGLNETIEIEAFHQRKQQFELPPFSFNAYAGVNPKRTDSPHPDLHHQLRKQRDIICAKKDLPIYIVAGTSTIDEMARYLPQSLTELRKITGFGDAKIEQYGKQFLDIIIAYCEEHNLSSLINEKAPKKEKKQRVVTAKKKTDSFAETFKLYKEGKTVKAIALERNLTASTIEGHLSKFIGTGAIKPEELLSPSKLVAIETALKGYNGGPMSLIKQQLGNDVSYGEIKIVMAGLGLLEEKLPD